MLDELSGSFERVTLAYRAELEHPSRTPEAVYFPIDCLLSVVCATQDGQQIEVTAVGREGFVGLGAVLDGVAPLTPTFTQIAGDAYRLPLAAMREAFDRHPEVRARVRAYAACRLDQYAQDIACARLHVTTERIARWLLTMHDRVGRDEFPITHEILAVMLGVRRAGISLAAAALQSQGAIAYARGRFTVVDRAALEAASCECYEITTGALARHGLRPPRG